MHSLGWFLLGFGAGWWVAVTVFVLSRCWRMKATKLEEDAANDW